MAADLGQVWEAEEEQLRRSSGFVCTCTVMFCTVLFTPRVAPRARASTSTFLMTDSFLDACRDRAQPMPASLEGTVSKAYLNEVRRRYRYQYACLLLGAQGGCR